MKTAQHTVADMARVWRHPSVVAAKAIVRATNPRDKAAYKAALNGVRDAVQSVKG